MARNNDNVGEMVLLGILGVAVYLLYRSVQNVGSSISGITSSVSTWETGVNDTVSQELANIAAAPKSAFNALGSVGTSAYNVSQGMFGSVSSWFSGDSLASSGGEVAGLLSSVPTGLASTGADDVLNGFQFNPDLNIQPVPNTTYNGESNGDGSLPSDSGGFFSDWEDVDTGAGSGISLGYGFDGFTGDN